MVSTYFHRCISTVLILIQVVSPLSVFAYSGIDSSVVFDSRESIQTLVQERERYDKERSGLTDVTIFDSHSELLGSTYVIERSSRMSGEIGDRIVTSDLLYNTLIRNISQSNIDPGSIAVRPTTNQQHTIAEQKF